MWPLILAMVGVSALLYSSKASAAPATGGKSPSVPPTTPPDTVWPNPYNVARSSSRPVMGVKEHIRPVFQIRDGHPYVVDDGEFIAVELKDNAKEGIYKGKPYPYAVGVILEGSLAGQELIIGPFTEDDLKAW